MLTCVITGGPTSGKTTVLHTLNAVFTARGVHTYVIKDTVEDLKSWGIRPHNTLSEYDFYKFALMEQIQRENIVELAAHRHAGNGNKVLVLCDRGIADFKSAVGKYEYEDLLREIELSTDKILPRYDMVCHMSPTYSSESSRTKNGVVLTAWEEHPKRIIYNKSEYFEDKLNSVIEDISHELEKH